MRKIKAYYYLFGICIVYLSCNPKKEAPIPDNYIPKVVPARLTPIPKITLAPPRVIPIDEHKVKKNTAGRPTIITAFNNTLVAGIPKKVVAGKPRIITPGTDTFLLPQKIPVVEKPIIAGMPETFVAKDMAYKIPNPYGFSYFGKLQGLKHTIISCLLQDKLGNLWFGSPGGATRYDGHSFSVFAKKEGLVWNDVRSILQDKSGNIWLGTLGGGVSKFDGISFTNFTVNDGLINGNVVNMIQDKAGNIWMATWGGVSKFDGHSFTNFTQKQGLVNNFVESVLEDNSGNLWFGTKEGVSKFNGSSFANFTEKEGLSHNDAYCIIQDRSGKIWFGTYGGGVSIYDGFAFTHLTENEGLINNEVGSMMEDNDGIVWLGTHYGLSAYDGHSFKNFTERQGLTNGNIYCSLQDQSGNLWFGTASGGVMKFNPHSFYHFTEHEGLLRNYTMSLYEDNSGKLWIGMWRGGVAQYDGSTFKSFTENQGLSNNDVRTICEDKKGNFWFGTAAGVSRFDGQYFDNYNQKDGLISNYVTSSLVDSKGNIWFGTEEGVSKFDGQSFINFSQKEGLTDNRVYCIKEDRYKNIWFCVSEGIIKYDGKDFFHFDLKTILFENAVSGMLEDNKGNFWFSTTGSGLLKFDGNSITIITEREGLANNNASSILQDKLGNIWVGTSFGLSKMTPEKSALLSARLKTGFINEDDVFFENYGYADGFLGVGCTYALIQSGDHKIWVGTINEATAFNPVQELKDTTQPNTQITAIKLFNENIDWTKLNLERDTSFLLRNGIRVANFRFDSLSYWYKLPQRLSLGHNNNYISFAFVGITTNQSHYVKYQYWLEGFEKKMSLPTSQNSATYGNLSPGNYTFRVRAMNSEGYWSRETTFSFTIRPPWWKTWGFRVVAVLILATLLFFISRFIYLFQLRKQKIAIEKQLAIQYERQRISSDLHDEIGSTLSSVNIYAGLAKKDPFNPLYLDSINQNVNEVVSKLDDLVWSIRPIQDSLGAITERLIAYADPAAKIKGVIFHLNIEPQLKDLKLSGGTKHHLYMSTKELINNAIKHAECKNLKVEFKMINSGLMIVVKDNGKGFDSALVKQERNGFRNISERVKEMKGKLTIESKPGKGTTANIEIPA